MLDKVRADGDAVSFCSRPPHRADDQTSVLPVATHSGIRDYFNSEP